VILYNRKSAKKNFILYIVVFLLLLDLLGVRANLVLSDRLTETLFHVFIIKIISNFLPYELDIYILRIKSEFFFYQNLYTGRAIYRFPKNIILEEDY
jgi:hypothetical protein